MRGTDNFSVAESLIVLGWQQFIKLNGAVRKKCQFQKGFRWEEFQKLVYGK
jgi:hypothetical protein